MSVHNEESPSSQSLSPSFDAHSRRALRQAVYHENPVAWLFRGIIRIIYRGWTRIAARLFPEESRQTHIAERIGLPLPDSLNLSWITPDLAVGGRIHTSDLMRLQQEGVTRVVDVRSEHQDDEAALQQYHMELLYLPTPDTYPLSLADLARGAEWINAQRATGQRVLVHCEHGVGRSVLLAAAALVDEGYTARDAFALVAQKRWQASPNHRQAVRLLEYEQQQHLS